MNALYQRLKELDSKTFERLCFQLLKERHPEIDIKHVEGKAGDEGIDSFAGEINGEMIIWQAKAFPDGVREPQKEQIRKSLKAARKHNVKNWILCLSIDMDVKAHRWFEKFKTSSEESSSSRIGLMQASDIVRELIHRRTLREAFFPGAVLDAASLRSLLTGTGKLSNEELGTLASENVDQIVQRLKDHDARFTYEITFGGDRGPQVRAPQLGLVASITNAGRTVDVFARDLEALKLSPPTISVEVQGAGVEKMKSIIRTGLPQDFMPGEVTKFTSSLAFVAGVDLDAPLTMRMGAAVPSFEPLSTRITFGLPPDPVIYDWIEFKMIRRGSEEVEFEGTGDVPFRLRLVLNLKDGSGKLSLLNDFVNADVYAVRKAMAALEATRVTPHFEVYDLKRSKVILRFELSGIESDRYLERLVNDAAFVAETYGVNLRLPAEVTEADVEALVTLKRLAEGALVVTGDCAVTLGKLSADTTQIEQLLGDGVALRLEREQYEPTQTLFGVPIPTGPIIVDIQPAIAKDPQAAREAYEAADIGGGVVFEFVTPNGMKFRLDRPKRQV